MEELLILVLQGLFEFLFDVASGLGHWPLTNDTKQEKKDGLNSWLIWVFAGGLMAVLSLVAFRHTFIPTPQLRIANLLLAPVASAFLTQHIAKQRALTNPNIIPRQHFWQAFWYAIGFVVVRFAYVSRS